MTNSDLELVSGCGLGHAGLPTTHVVPRSLLDLPAFPPVALEALGMLASDNASFGTLADVLGNDPVMMCDVLHHANAAVFGQMTPVKSLRHAILVLGLNRLRAHILATALRGALRPPLVASPQFRRWWRHSIAVASLSEALAGGAHSPPDEAYAAGLMHDIGRLAVMVNISAAYYAAFDGSVVNASINVLELERMHFGIDHCEAGGMLLTEWRFPGDLVSAVAHHHDEQTFSADTAGVLRLACALSSRAGFRGVRWRPRTDYAGVKRRLPAWATSVLDESWPNLRGSIRSRLNYRSMI